MSSSEKSPDSLWFTRHDRQKPPKWLPMSLLAVTTVALTVPAILLWRQKKASGLPRAVTRVPPARRQVVLNHKLKSEEPRLPTNAQVPPRPVRTGGAPPPRRLQNGPVIATQKPVISQTSASSRAEPLSEEGETYGPFHAIGAFGVATTIVILAAAGTVWGTQKALNVENVDQFSMKVRQLLQTHLPELSNRIYRRNDEPEVEVEKSNSGDSDRWSKDKWSWSDAEDRLRTAFDKGGVAIWAEAAIRELEAEAEQERSKRGL